MRDTFKPDRVTILPAGWREIPSHLLTDGHIQRAYGHVGGLRVITGGEKHGGERWLHVSVTRADRIPDWRDLKEIKDIFVGRDRKAVQVLPPEAEYVNVHEYCMHLYSNLERDPLPDFNEWLTC